MLNKKRIALILTATIIPGGYIAWLSYWIYNKLKRKEKI